MSPDPSASPDDTLIDGLSARRLGALNLVADTVLPGEEVKPQPTLTLTPEELAPHFPQLEILECLGRGGMGVVYKARQKSLNRMVALKLLAPERADDPQFATRFEKEAHALAALNHPNIVGVYDFGKAGGFYFLLMEFVDGVNLRQLLQTKRLTPKEALSIVPPVCEALQCAHDHGIVHRDIKPENLLIDKAGIVKIADFGIAKMIGEGAHDLSSSPATHQSHAALGTPDYAAPEQTNGIADHRADIYSLGVVLYEMLTGERPKEKLEAPSKRVQVDIRIDEIVLRALEKTPELRFATAAEFRTQVDLLGKASGAHSAREQFRRRLLPPAVTFGLIYASMIAYVVVSSQKMPARFAIHFDGQGRPNGWATAGWNNAFMTLPPLFVLGLCCLICWLSWKSPKIFPLNVPHKEYWDAPEHRGEAIALLGRSLLWFCCIITLFLGAVHWQIVESNRVQPPRLDAGSMIPMLTGLFTLSIMWIVNLIYSYTKIDVRPSSISAAQLPSRSHYIVSAVVALVVLASDAWLFHTLKQAPAPATKPAGTKKKDPPATTPASSPQPVKGVEQVKKENSQTMGAVRARLTAFHHGEPANHAMIKVVYFHAKDREPLADYAQRLERVLTDVSAFYRDGLAQQGVVSRGVPFERDASGKIKLRLVRGQHEAAHYSYASGDETWAEVTQALAGEIDAAKDHVLILYGQCDKARDGRYIFNAPYYGAGWSDHRHGLCHAADCELLDPLLLTAKDRSMVFTEHYYPRQEMSVAQFNSWYIGGIAHELGHTFGLPHDAGSPGEAALGTSLMGAGNLTYREDLHGGTKPAFLSLASAIRLAAHPLISGSDKARWQAVNLGPCAVEATAAGRTLVLSGQVEANLPACAVIASIWPASAEEGQDHGALTFCSAVDAQGRFKVEITPPGADEWNLKLGAVLANGAEPQIRTTFTVDAQGRPLAEVLTMKLQVDLVEQMLMRSPDDAKEFLTDEAIARSTSGEAQRRLKLLQRMTLPEPQPVDLTTTNETRVFVSDAAWTKAEVGWGKVARNRYDPVPDVWQGLLLKLAGKVYNKGLYAHAKSAFVFPLAGKWQTFSATVGLRDGGPEVGSAVFIIEGDGVELVRSTFLRPGMSEPMKTDVTGVKTLTLRAEGSQGHNHGSWSIWCDPLIERKAK